MKIHLALRILFSAVAGFPAVPFLHAADSEPPATRCNPLAIPNYPVGRRCRDLKNGDPVDMKQLWLLPHAEQFRELADPCALWHEGKWFLYPSVDMAWVSADQGATWSHHPLNLRDIGYAPTVVKYAGRFLLMASESEIHASSSPLGPFERVGRIDFKDHNVPGHTDPMLFSDDDGRLYYYWGCTRDGGIWAVELDAKDPVKILTVPKEVIPFSPDNYPWERTGDWNQNPGEGWMEGAWMIKCKDTYHLTYSAAGTQHRTYAMGCYTSKSPLGPFVPQKRNPIFRTTDGLITGTAHGCIVRGPQDGLWTFYIIRAGVAHGFERRIGLDPVEVDENGELHVPAATSTPQWRPGKSPENRSETGWLPMNGGVPTKGSTTAPNLTGSMAVDNELRTWWQPAAGDERPMLTSLLLGPATVHAVRIVWRDVGLDSNRGVAPGPFRYRVELETGADQWTTLVDRSDSNEDLLIDYRECTPRTGTAARLVITGGPQGITPGVAEFTVFGKPAGR